MRFCARDVVDVWPCRLFLASLRSASPRNASDGDSAQKHVTKINSVVVLDIRGQMTSSNSEPPVLRVRDWHEEMV